MAYVGTYETGKLITYPIRDNIDGQGTQLINWVIEVSRADEPTREGGALLGHREPLRDLDPLVERCALGLEVFDIGRSRLLNIGGATIVCEPGDSKLGPAMPHIMLTAPESCAAVPMSMPWSTEA